MKVPFHFQFMLIIYKTELVTYHFYFFFGKVLALVNSSDNLSHSNESEVRAALMDLGGITTGIPPGFRFAPRIPVGTWRELTCRDFGRRGSASCRESRRDLGGLTHQDFGRRDYRFSLRILERSRRDSPLGKIDLHGV